MKIFDFDGLNRNSSYHSGIEKKLKVLIVLKIQLGLIFSGFSCSISMLRIILCLKIIHYK